ncbi:MAG: chain length-determining protein [Pseudomonadota bacterium]
MHIDLLFYWKLLLRRLPVMAALVLIFGGLGFADAQRKPATYNAAARLLVETPQIPDDLAASTVRDDAAEQLTVIQQQLMTRANLIDIANEFEVFPNRAEMNPDQVVARMRRATSFGRSGGGRNQSLLLTVRFRAPSGEVAAAVVNEYTTRILEASAEFRMSRAEGTLEFFEQEVARLDTELSAQSARIVAFRNENPGALPDGQSFRLNRQSLLQERLGRLDTELREAVQRREQVVAIFEQSGEVANSGTRQLSGTEQRLATARAELNQMLERFSEVNPRVVAQRNRIERLEEIVAEQENRRAGAVLNAFQDQENAPQTPEEALYQMTLSDIDSRITSLERQIVNANRDLESVTNAIAASAGNAIALNELQREMNLIQTRYNEAARNLNEARMGERIEVTAQGQRVTVIESATVPRQPAGPNRTRIALTGVATGGALALGYFVLLEFLNRSIRRPVELKSRFGITPIATIPYMESRAQRWLRRISLVTAMVAVVLGVPAALWWVDTHYMPLQLIVEQGLQRIGLT